MESEQAVPVHGKIGLWGYPYSGPGEEIGTTLHIDRSQLDTLLRRLSRSSVSPDAMTFSDQIVNAQQQIIDDQDQVILRLQKQVHDLSQQLESLAGSEIEEETEILDLQPLSRRRVNAEVRRYYEPARIQIVEEAGDTDSEDTGE